MKRDGRSLAHNILEEMRRLAIRRMEEGERPTEVAASFGLHRGWAYKCRAAARSKGLEALRSTRGSGRPRRLTSEQEAQIFVWVNGKNPQQYGFDFGLWTRQVVRELVNQKLGVLLSLASIGAILARVGLTPQKPLQRAYQRDQQAVDHWVKESYPALARRARKERAEIYFWDESGFRAEAVHGKTWGAKGQTPVVQRPGQRPSVSAASAVNAKGAFWFEMYEGALTGERFVELLERMMAGQKRPVHLVIDGLPAHKKACVRQYVAQTQGRLTLHFLPGYSPDLNPDELVWSHTKRTGVARNPLRKGERLLERIKAQLQFIAETPTLVQSFFTHQSEI
jgi:transposase